jgi:inhibitor of cysteine peptidase
VTATLYNIEENTKDTEEINMKKLVFLGLVAVMLLPLLAIGCGGGPKSVTLEVTLDDFTAQSTITRNITIDVNGTLTVKLGSNPTTGYSWEDAVIGVTTIIDQTSHEYVAPTATEVVGAPGTDVWVFTAKSSGSTTITFNYSRPWESGPALYALTINVLVNH